MRLTFLPRPPPPASRKRRRAVADIDGEHSCVQKKKRRLRRFLITSRLSPQFSHPASNIVDRGSSKIAVWAKQKALGRNWLPKAAILNGIRRRNILAKDAFALSARLAIAQEKEEAQLELARLEFTHGSIDTYTRPVLSRDPSVPPTAAVRSGNHFVVSGSPSTSPSASRSPSPTWTSPDEATAFCSPNQAWAAASSPAKAHAPRRDYLPLPPSPLGISNYDAFDTEEPVMDLYADLDDQDEPLPSPFDDQDEDEEVPFSPSAVMAHAPTTVRGGTTHATNEYSSYSVLDYRHINQVDGFWPDTTPDMSTLMVSGHSAPKRTDSFATSPNFGPCMLKKAPFPGTGAGTTAGPASPNFGPLALAEASFSPAATSPNFVSTTAPCPRSPNLGPVLMSSLLAKQKRV